MRADYELVGNSKRILGVTPRSHINMHIHWVIGWSISISIFIPSASLSSFNSSIVGNSRLAVELFDLTDKRKWKRSGSFDCLPLLSPPPLVSVLEKELRFGLHALLVCCALNLRRVMREWVEYQVPTSISAAATISTSTPAPWLLITYRHLSPCP